MMFGFSPAMLAMRAAMMVPMGGRAIIDNPKKEKKRLNKLEEERNRKFTEYILSEKERIKSVANEQRRITNQENPTTSGCIEVVRSLTSQLWERQPADSDFLQVRVGDGYDELCVPVKSPVNSEEYRAAWDDLEKLVETVVEETKLVDEVAARVDLRAYTSVGIYGDRKKAIRLVKNLLISLTALHYFKDVKIVGVFDPEEDQVWKSLRWLPHIWDDDKQTRFLSFDECASQEYTGSIKCIPEIDILIIDHGGTFCLKE